MASAPTYQIQSLSFSLPRLCVLCTLSPSFCLWHFFTLSLSPPTINLSRSSHSLGMSEYPSFTSSSSPKTSGKNGDEGGDRVMYAPSSWLILQVFTSLRHVRGVYAIFFHERFLCFPCLAPKDILNKTHIIVLGILGQCKRNFVNMSGYKKKAEKY